MLVLSRNVEQEIVLTLPSKEQIIFQVVAIKKDRVRLGIKAPLSITIHRREIQDKVDGEE